MMAQAKYIGYEERFHRFDLGPSPCLSKICTTWIIIYYSANSVSQVESEKISPTIVARMNSIPKAPTMTLLSLCSGGRRRTNAQYVRTNITANTPSRHHENRTRRRRRATHHIGCLEEKWMRLRPGKREDQSWTVWKVVRGLTSYLFTDILLQTTISRCQDRMKFSRCVFMNSCRVTQVLNHQRGHGMAQNESYAKLSTRWPTHVHDICRSLS